MIHGSTLFQWKIPVQSFSRKYFNSTFQLLLKIATQFYGKFHGNCHYVFNPNAGKYGPKNSEYRKVLRHVKFANESFWKFFVDKGKVLKSI